MPSPAGGTVKELLVNEGESAAVGQTIAVIE
jgi:pyruvate/2-oxoglutarate dehydrogenase complex dihydrolipoamide acyltransferase (E2) component